VTSWEVIEHISEQDLIPVSENVAKHLDGGGIWIMSVSPNIEIIDGIHLHQTVQPKSWWIRKFEQLGWTNLETHLHYFNTQFVRGPKYGAPGSFHLILTREVAQTPAVPEESLLVRIYDSWLGSGPQRILKLLIAGL
jgi:hypothetical protein